MCCMEIADSSELSVPLNIVVIGNASMGLIRKNQYQLYGERYLDCDFINPDFSALARIRHCTLSGRQRRRTSMICLPPPTCAAR